MLYPLSYGGHGGQSRFSGGRDRERLDRTCSHGLGKPMLGGREITGATGDSLGFRAGGTGALV